LKSKRRLLLEDGAILIVGGALTGMVVTVFGMAMLYCAVFPSKK
jgi:hypothetical protein